MAQIPQLSPPAPHAQLAKELWLLLILSCNNDRDSAEEQVTIIQRSCLNIFLLMYDI